MRNRGDLIRRGVRIFGITALVAAVVLGAVLVVDVVLMWRSSGALLRYQPSQPSRLYGEPMVLREGLGVSASQLVTYLRRAGYIRSSDELRGTFRASDDAAVIMLKRRGERPTGALRVHFSGSRVTGLSLDGEPIAELELEPPLLHNYYDENMRETLPIDLETVPEHLMQAMLAAEDHEFFEHPGVSFMGILRAALVNVRAGDIEQGGSTITQQLVKNLFLTHERTLWRKMREANIALLMEMRYSKRQILEAYLNEIYLGVQKPINIVGVGAAARAYFGRDVENLTLPQSALLAAMVKSPGSYSPTSEPESARNRRNWVLDRMAELEWISADEAAAAQEAPVELAGIDLHESIAPYFAAFVRSEAEERFDIDELDGGGYRLLSTLRLADQIDAGNAVRWGADRAERVYERGHDEPLQASLVSMDPSSGAILAYIGGRNWSASQFDRVAQARRQTGSAFKPVVYAAAYRDRVFTPSSMLEDSPIVVHIGRKTWQPQNSDRSYRGRVSARRALELSLNVPTVRVAVATGLSRIANLGEALGFTDLETVPALSLGAFEASPLEMATAYAAFATLGYRPTPHAVARVLAPDGDEVSPERPASRERVLDSQTAYLVTHVLQGAVRRGTAWRVREYGVGDPIAGKTGTSNERRDSWFAGYSPERVTVVWVGYDGNDATSLSGARAAVPIYGRFTRSVRPPGGFSDFERPGGLQTAVIDPVSGLLATESCPESVTEIYPSGGAPIQECNLHGFDAFPEDILLGEGGEDELIEDLFDFDQAEEDLDTLLGGGFGRPNGTPGPAEEGSEPAAGDGGPDGRAVPSPTPAAIRTPPQRFPPTPTPRPERTPPRRFPPTPTATPAQQRAVPVVTPATLPTAPPVRPIPTAGADRRGGTGS